MKRFVLFVFSVNIFSTCFAIDYYSKVSGSPSFLANWNTLANGTGSAPPGGSFTAAGNKFIIQNGHTMITTAIWTIGSATSTLQIQNGGILQGDHLIKLTGTFQIDNGGKYIHTDFTNVGTVAGVSIWGGTEVFAANSTVEIQDWTTNATPLPAITWGNLIINLTSTIGSGAWVQGTNLTSIQGNLQIKATSGNDFQFATNTSVTVNIGGNLVIDAGCVLTAKTGTSAGISCNVQVNGNITVNSGGTLNTGSADIVTHADLKYKGSFTAAAGSTITSGDNNSFLVANGTSAQTLTCAPALICNFRVDPSATVNQSGSITNGTGYQFAILGTYNDNGFSKTMGGIVDVGGGTLNATGSIAMGSNRIRVGTGDGTYTGGSSGWQTASGTRGLINFTGNAITFNQINTATLSIGSLGPGDVYMTNSAISFATGAGTGSVTLNSGCIFSLDGSSYVNGKADYLSAGGTLRIGSADGITAAGNTTNGNIRVSGLKTYNAAGVFEYVGTVPQVTGNGLPTAIAGTLRIDNYAGISSMGVTLTSPTTINGFLDLDQGKLRSSATSLITISATGNFNSYGPDAFIGGPLQVIGHSGFTFPVGINAAAAPTGSIYAPVVMNHVSGTSNATDSYTAEYIRGNPQTATGLGSAVQAPINHVSFVEYWSFLRTDGGVNTPVKQIVLEVNPESICYRLDSLLVARYDQPSSQWKSEGLASFIPLGSSPPLVWGKIFSFSAITVFGYFTLGTKDLFADSPLPINLISFDAAKLTNTKATINWELAAYCSASAKFEIQRAGTDKRFITIGTVTGNVTNRLYNYIDNDLKNGINFYRLKMIDENGKITYSRTVAVMNGVNGLLLTSLIPTLVTNTATLTIASSRQQKLDLVIVDMQGRVVMKQNQNIVAGNTSIELPTGCLAAGVYQLGGMTAEGKTNMIRFVKQ